MNKRIIYHKLVRDLIPAKIESAGDTHLTRVLDDTTEFLAALRAKVIEEATELAATTDRAEFLKEYADLMVALDALTAQYEVSEAEMKVAMTESVERKGLFKERFFLEWSEYKN